MEDVRISESAEQALENREDEKEQYNKFINVMVQIVEKYGKSVLQELDSVA